MTGSDWCSCSHRGTTKNVSCIPLLPDRCRHEILHSFCRVSIQFTALKEFVPQHLYHCVELMRNTAGGQIFLLKHNYSQKKPACLNDPFILLSMSIRKVLCTMAHCDWNKQTASWQEVFIQTAQGFDDESLKPQLYCFHKYVILC